MKQETYLTYYLEDENAVTETTIVNKFSDMETAFKQAQNQATVKIGRTVHVFKEIEAFSAEVVVRPVKQTEAPAKPRKARSDKGTKKSRQKAPLDDSKSDSNTAAETNPDEPLFSIPEKLKKK